MKVQCYGLIITMMLLPVLLYGQTLSEISPVALDDLTTDALALPEETLFFSLGDVVGLMLENNLDIKISKINLEITRDEIPKNKGIYDPVLNAEALESEREGRTLSETGIQEGERKIRAATIALSQLLPTGGAIEVGFEDTRYWTEDGTYPNPSYSQDMTLSLVHPLLKNLGMYITNYTIAIAKNNAQISDYEFQQTVLDRLKDVLWAYWDLVAAIENYKVKQLSLSQAQDLLRINTIKQKAGVLASTDVLLARSRVSEREEQLIIAESLIKRIEDALKKLLDIRKEDPLWNYSIRPREKMIYEEVELNELAVIEEALQKRPDYLALLVERDTSLLTRKVAANQRLPQLDFFADYGFSGLDDSHSDTNDVLRTLDYNNWQAGVQFSYPLFNRDARYTYRQAQKQVVLVEKTLENMQQFIAIQLRNIIRDINTSLKRIHVTADAVSYEEAKLRDQQKRFDVGMATSFEVLEFQEDLSETRVRNIQAIVSYNKSLIELSYDRGTLIEERNIEIETIDAAQ